VVQWIGFYVLPLERGELQQHFLHRRVGRRKHTEKVVEHPRHVHALRRPKPAPGGRCSHHPVQAKRFHDAVGRVFGHEIPAALRFLQGQRMQGAVLRVAAKFLVRHHHRAALADGAQQRPEMFQSAGLASLEKNLARVAFSRVQRIQQFVRFEQAQRLLPVVGVLGNGVGLQAAVVGNAHAEERFNLTQVALESAQVGGQRRATDFALCLQGEMDVRKRRRPTLKLLQDEQVAGDGGVL